MRLLRAFSFCLLVGFCAGVSPALAQVDSQGGNERPMLRGSNRALSFTIDDLHLGSLDGGVGVRWFIGQRSALRTTLRLSVESTETVNEGQNKVGRSAFGIGSTFLVEWHTHAFRSVSPYVAAGAGLQFDAFSETEDYSDDNPILKQRNKGNTVDFIVNAGMGVEVYLTRSVSLSGEYLFEGVVRSASGKVVNTMRDAPETSFNRDTTSFRFGTGTSSLIVSVFF